uniref:Uncharacterized protein n=1 Tax=Anguilla anguilla TaxID=7936 RepID=A0A0E9TA75_ANGAN
MSPSYENNGELVKLRSYQRRDRGG